MFRNIWTKRSAQPSRPRRVVLQVEQLETRLTPAPVTSFAVLNPYTATYTDLDGDLVTVKVSKPVLASDRFSFLLAGAPRLQLQSINLDLAEAAGTNLTITARRQDTNGDGVKEGDGLANVGYVVSRRNLGAVSIQGDLGVITCGENLPANIALKSLSVQSLGLNAALTGAPAYSNIYGSLGSLKVKDGIYFASVLVYSGGNIGRVTVGGSIIGGSAVGSGEIFAEGSLGPVKIGGDLIGGSGSYSGSIGAGYSNVSAAGHSVARVTIGGSVIGGTAGGSGMVFSQGTLGAVRIGNLVGGAADFTGVIRGAGIKSVYVTGSISCAQSLTVFQQTGSIISQKDIGSITIKGGIAATQNAHVLISAVGQATPTATKDLAIKRLTVGGSVQFTRIRAGFDGLLLQPVNADAQIGAIKVGGDWKASSVLAGVDDTGLNATKIGHDGTPLSKIGSVTITGKVFGDEFFPGVSLGLYAFAAEEVGSFKYNRITIGLIAGPHNDTHASGNDERVGGDDSLGAPAVRVFEV